METKIAEQTVTLFLNLLVFNGWHDDLGQPMVSSEIADAFAETVNAAGLRDSAAVAIAIAKTNPNNGKMDFAALNALGEILINHKMFR